MASRRNIEKLLDALAQKLPKDARRSTLESALRAAIDGLPQSKTRDRLLTKQKSYLGVLQKLLQEKEETDEGTLAERVAENVEEEGEDQEDVANASAPTLATAPYAGLEEEGGTAALLQRCEELLASAMASIRPAARAEEALEGLLAFVPPESPDAWGPLDAGNLQVLAQLLPKAAAALEVLGADDTPAAWQRFLGLAIISVVSVAEDLPASGEQEVSEVADRLGNVGAIVACPSTARGALRCLAALNTVGTASATLLMRLARTAMPLMPIAFGAHLSELARRQKPTRGELSALLGALRFLRLFSKSRESEPGTDDSSRVSLAKISEVRRTLQAALGRDFDVTPILPELGRLLEEHSSRLPRCKALKKRLAACIAGPRSAATAASVSSEILEALAHILHQSQLSRLVACSGLEADEDERPDTRAARAKAQGAAFFEDVAGGAGTSEAISEAASEAQKRTFEPLEGLEDLQQSELPGSPKRPRRRRKSVGAAT